MAFLLFVSEGNGKKRNRPFEAVLARRTENRNARLDYGVLSQVERSGNRCAVSRDKAQAQVNLNSVAIPIGWEI